MSKPHYSYLSYNQIATKIDTFVPEIRRMDYDAIVVIVRGGLFPGTHLSVRTGLPIYYLAYHRKLASPKVTWIGESAPHKKILLVEDMAGSGKTLISCEKFLIDLGYCVDTFVVFKDLLSASNPKFCGFSTSVPGHTFLLPWERTKLNPQYESMDKSERFVDHELEFTVFNANCFFKQDEMNRYVKWSISPMDMIETKDIIYIDEPSKIFIYQDLFSTEGIQTPLCPARSYELGADASSSFSESERLGADLIRLGCTRYVGNDLERLVLLSSQFPHLEVIWWNNGTPVSLSGSLVMNS